MCDLPSLKRFRVHLKKKNIYIHTHTHTHTHTRTPTPAHALEKEKLYSVIQPINYGHHTTHHLSRVSTKLTKN